MNFVHKTFIFLAPLLFAANLFAATNLGSSKFYIHGENRMAYLHDHDVPNRSAQGTTSYDVFPSRLLFGLGYRASNNMRIFTQGAFLTLWGKENGNSATTKSQVDKVQLAQAYIEIEKLSFLSNIKIGRQLYDVSEFTIKPSFNTLERMIYRSLDGVTATLSVPTTQLMLVAGQEADLIDSYLKDYLAAGFESRTFFNENIMLHGYFYNYYHSSQAYSGTYGLKPALNYGNTHFYFRYLRAYTQDKNRFDEQGQLFQWDLRHKFSSLAADLTPRAGMAWATSGPLPTLTLNRSIIVEQIYGSSALSDAIAYNLGFDAAFKNLDKIKFMADVYYYQSTKTGVADKGCEVDVKVRADIIKNLEITAGAGYLFANSKFQNKDAKKLQILTVYKF